MLNTYQFEWKLNLHDWKHIFSKDIGNIKMGTHFLFFLENIDRHGIDYLRLNLPSDHRTFPMIAEKRKL